MDPDIPGFVTLDPSGETVTVDEARFVQGSPNNDGVTINNAANFAYVILDTGSDSLTLNSFGGQDVTGIPGASAIVLLTDLDAQTTESEDLIPDNEADTINIGSDVFDVSDLPSGASRSVVLLGFGPEDTLNLQGVSADNANVFLDQELPSFLPVGQLEGLPTGSDGVDADELEGLQSGTSILVNDEIFITIFRSFATPAFTSEGDFNSRVSFGGGGSASFDERPDLDEVLEDFRNTGRLPDAAIPGVFELPTGADGDDQVIDVGEITVEIGGETVTFNPRDPFFFDDLPAEAREAILADPELAVGYDYQISDPAAGQAFASVMAPSVGGDTSYNLVVFAPDGGAQPTREIAADETVDFEAEFDFPVTRFLIEGISPDAALMPDDGQAFPTAISFTESGSVDLQQTPLVQDVNTANVFLEAAGAFTVAGSLQVIGRGGASAERIYLTSEASNVRADANIERIDIGLSASALDVGVTPDGFTISRGGTEVLSIPSLNGTLDLRFTDGDVSVTQVGATRFQVDGEGDSTVVEGANGALGVTLGGDTASAPVDPSATANVFVNADSAVTLADAAQVFGRGGASTEGVILLEGTRGVGLDANLESLRVPQSLDALAFEVTEDGLAVLTGGTVIATTPSLNNPLALRVEDGEATLTQTGATTFELAGNGQTATIGSGGDPVQVDFFG